MAAKRSKGGSEIETEKLATLGDDVAEYQSDGEDENDRLEISDETAEMFENELMEGENLAKSNPIEYMEKLKPEDFPDDPKDLFLRVFAELFLKKSKKFSA